MLCMLLIINYIALLYKMYFIYIKNVPRDTRAALACRVVHGYMVCARARVAWLHGSRVCRVVTWFARVSHVAQLQSSLKLAIIIIESVGMSEVFH